MLMFTTLKSKKVSGTERNFGATQTRNSAHFPREWLLREEARARENWRRAKKFVLGKNRKRGSGKRITSWIRRKQNAFRKALIRNMCIAFQNWASGGCARKWVEIFHHLSEKARGETNRDNLLRFPLVSLEDDSILRCAQNRKHFPPELKVNDQSFLAGAFVDPMFKGSKKLPRKKNLGKKVSELEWRNQGWSRRYDTESFSSLLPLFSQNRRLIRAYFQVWHGTQRRKEPEWWKQGNERLRYEARRRA